MVVELKNDDLSHLIEIVSELPDFAFARSRYTFLTAILAGIPKGDRLLSDIDFDGTPRVVATHIVHLLSKRGKVMPGREALGLLIDGLLHNRGEDEISDFLRGLIDQYQLKIDEDKVSLPNVSLPTAKPILDVVNDYYIFISYARPQTKIAEQVENYLTQAGFRVFRDQTSIQVGMDWNLVIEQALEQGTHLVLIMSSSSMPYRKEVYREWFYFDQKGKPIIPLYVEDCKLPSRLLSVNYMDMRENFIDKLPNIMLSILK